jgi:hypothetical protein
MFPFAPPHEALLMTNVFTVCPAEKASTELNKMANKSRFFFIGIFNLKANLQIENQLC